MKRFNRAREEGRRKQQMRFGILRTPSRGVTPLRTTAVLNEEQYPDQQLQEEPRRTKLPAHMISPKLVKKHMRKLQTRQRQREAARQQATPPTALPHAVTKLSRNRWQPKHARFAGEPPKRGRKLHKLGVPGFVRRLAQERHK